MLITQMAREVGVENEISSLSQKVSIAASKWCKFDGTWHTHTAHTHTVVASSHTHTVYFAISNSSNLKNLKN